MREKSRENFKPSARWITEHACYNYKQLKANTPLAWRPGVSEQNDDLSGADNEKAIVRGEYAKCQAQHIDPLTKKAIFFLLLLADIQQGVQI